MKLKIKKKKHNRHEEDESPRRDREEKKMGGPSWAIKGREEIQRAQRRSEVEAKSGRRPPELWVRPEESAMIRFLSNDPIAAIFRYRLQVNGKWIAATAPAPGEPDLMKRAGLRPQLVHVYPVIDMTGYIDKQTKKKMKNNPRYLSVPGRVEKQIDRFRAKRGDITKFPAEYCRAGEGTDTTYSFLWEERAKMPEEFILAGRKLVKEFDQYYAPPSEEQQRIMLAGVTQEESEVTDRPVRKKRSFDDED